MKFNLGSLAILFCFGCSQSGPTLLSRYEIVREDDHLGEYAQALSPNELITFNRHSKDGTNCGLVKVNLTDKTIDVLDFSASEGRDLILSNSYAIYRIQNQIRLIRISDAQPISLQIPANLSVTKLRTFLALESEFVLGLDLGTGESKLLRLNKDGAMKESVGLNGTLRLHVLLPQSQEVILLREPKRAALYQREGSTLKELGVLQEGLTAHYAAAEIFSSDWGIAYFDDDSGSLRWVKIGFDSKILSNELIDGEAKKTHRGLDIDILSFEERPIIAYLDGWALRSRIAKQNSDGTWTVKEIPIKGAVGFYSQILGYQDGLLKMTFHNFRTDHEVDRRQSFEDLALIEFRF